MLGIVGAALHARNGVQLRQWSAPAPGIPPVALA